jgi:transposase
MILELETLHKKELVRLLLDEQNRSKTQEQAIQKYEAQNAWLQYQLDELRRMIFGSKRERFEGTQSLPGQEKIEFEEYASETQQQDETQVKELIKVEYDREKAPKKHAGRNRIPESLLVIEHVIEPEQDTTGMKKIGEERTEILEYTPEKFFKLVILRPKYARIEQVDGVNESKLKNVVVAELPSRPIEKCLAGNNLLAAILINKYIDHLPLYRQLQIFRRSGIEIAPSTIDSWVAQLGTLFEPLYEKLVDEIKAQTYLQADETTTKVLDKNKKKETHLGYYWVYHAPMARLVAFNYQQGRGQNAPREFLQGYKGVLQTDGYIVYQHYYANEQVTHLACWAHARRKFEKALKSDSKRAEHAMLEIQKLYAIERKAKELSADERKEMRLKLALPIINELGKWLHTQRQQVLPKSPIGMAIAYITPLWTSLQNYLHDGNLHIDNNLIENSIRPVALGRKNYLFAGSHNGAKRSAMFYSFFACCKLNDINPQKWLHYVLEHIADYKANKLHELLPNNIDRQRLEKFKHIWEV